MTSSATTAIRAASKCLRAVTDSSQWCMARVLLSTNENTFDLGGGGAEPLRIYDN